MPLSNLDHKKVYYYVICVMAFFVLMWGGIDFASSSVGLININLSAASYSNVQAEGAEVVPQEKGDQFFDLYYQKKMLSDRFWDSLVRLIISGAIFIYCRRQIVKMEAAA